MTNVEETAARSVADDCPLCRADRVTRWYYESAECWVADCMVCVTPMVVWRPHGLPAPHVERALLDVLSETAAARFGEEEFWIDPDRRRIPDHWHAHARPRGGFFGPDSALYGKEWGAG